MRSHRHLEVLATSAILVALAGGPLLAAAQTQVSPKLGPSTYAQRDGRMSLFVDSFAASLREAETYVPISIALGVTGKGKTIRLDTESFTLTDRNGNEVPLAGYAALQEDYRKRLADDAVVRAHPMMLDSRFDALDRIRSGFFPSPGGRGTRVTRVELAPGTWLQDILYFPSPPSGTHGVMTLTIRGKGLDAPITVKFRVHPPDEDEPLQG